MNNESAAGGLLKRSCKTVRSSRHRFLPKTALLLTFIISVVFVPHGSADEPLQPQQPTADTSAPASSSAGAANSVTAGTGSAAPAAQSKVLKLGVSTTVRKDDGQTGAATLPDYPDTPVNHPFAALRALFGKSGLRASTYQLEDTGYGVCGFVLNVAQNGYTSIRQVFPSMPAAVAGIRTGDVVVSVNGESTVNMSQSEVWNWFTGIPGTDVAMIVVRAGQPVDVTLKRMDIGRIPDSLTRAVFLDSYRRNGRSRFVQTEEP